MEPGNRLSYSWDHAMGDGLGLRTLGNQGCYPTMFGSIQGIKRAKVETGAQESVPKEDFAKLEGVYPGGCHLTSIKSIYR